MRPPLPLRTTGRLKWERREVEVDEWRRQEKGEEDEGMRQEKGEEDEGMRQEKGEEDEGMRLRGKVASEKDGT